MNGLISNLVNADVISDPIEHPEMSDYHYNVLEGTRLYRSTP
jgi:hypothetical protein